MVSNLLRPARVLGTLALVTAVATAAAPGVIRIKPGDTLSGLARTHHTTVRQLQVLNGLTGTMIYAGETLRVPGAAPTRTPVVRTVSRTYVVRPGDNLTHVARALKTTPTALAARNHLRPGSFLIIGQRLQYGAAVRVAPTRTSTPTSSPTGTVGGSVAASAAAHRAQLRARSLPSKAAVRSLIKRSARRHGVPAEFALAVAFQESGFQQRVVSPVDAIGAMQVLPSTGRALGRLHGRSFDLLKASDNVEAGVLLLSDLLRATGTRERALQGYYQGLGSISRKGVLPQTHGYVTNVLLLQKRFS